MIAIHFQHHMIQTAMHMFHLHSFTGNSKFHIKIFAGNSDLSFSSKRYTHTHTHLLYLPQLYINDASVKITACASWNVHRHYFNRTKSNV